MLCLGRFGPWNAQHSRLDVTARRFFGAQRFTELSEVKGVSQRIVKEMESQWTRVKSMRDLVIYLQAAA